MIMIALAVAAAQPAPVAPSPVALNPRAADLFASDPLLERWAVGRFDRNSDGWLTLYEAQPAAEAFREIADADRDGRVTVREYEAAVAFIRARY